MSGSDSFDEDVRTVRRAGSSEPISPTMPRRNPSADTEPKKRKWRKSLDHTVLMVNKGAARTRTGSWNHGKDRSENPRKTREKSAVATSTSTKRKGDTASPSLRARVSRSGSLPANKVSEADSWESLEREAEEMAAEQEKDEERSVEVADVKIVSPSVERLPMKHVRRRKSDISRLDEDSEEEEKTAEEEEESVVKIRADAKVRVKHRKRGTPRGQNHLELDLSALLEKEPSDGKGIAFEGQEDDPVSPKRKVGRTAGGGFLSARGLDSIQIRKKTLNLTNNLTARSQSKSKPTRRVSSPSIDDIAESKPSDPLQTASWEGASQEVLDRRATKRERVLMELLMTERKFVSVLDAVVQFVLTPMRTNGVLPAEDVDTIFANIEDIFRLNQNLLWGMEGCMGKKRSRTGSKLSRKLSPTFAAKPEHIPTAEPLPRAMVEKLAHSTDPEQVSLPLPRALASTDPSQLSPRPYSPRTSSTGACSPRRSSPRPYSPRTASPRSYSPRDAPGSPRSFDSTSSSPRTSSSHASPSTPRSRTPTSPRTPRSPRSPPGSPLSPSMVPLSSSSLPAIPSSPDVNASRAPPAPGSPAPTLPRSGGQDDWVSECSSLGQLFMAYSKRMSIHTEFCSNHSRLLAEKKLKKMREDNPALARFLETCLLRPECQGQTLEAMLITIPQRVCRYPMLLLELIKNTPPSTEDYSLIVDAWKSVRDVVAEINAETEVASDFGALLDVQQVLQLSPSLGINLLQTHRKFVTRGVFKVSKASNYAFLFNDCLILAKTRGEFYKAKRVIRLSKLILRATGPGGQPIKQGTFSIQLAEIGERIIAVEFSTQQEMDQWVKHLQAAMASCTDGSAGETVSRMSTTHALASTMANLVSPLSPRGLLGTGGSQTELQKKKVSQRKAKKTKNRTMPRSLVMNGLGTSGSPSTADTKSDLLAALEKESRKRKAAEAKVKELEAEVKSLKKLLGEKSMLVGTLQGKLEKDRGPEPTKKKRSAFNSTKSASNLLAEFGEALVDASPKKMMTRKRREEEQASSGGVGLDSPLPKITREKSIVSFPEGVAGDEEEGSPAPQPKKGSTIIFANRSSAAAGDTVSGSPPPSTPPQRRRNLNHTSDSRSNSPAPVAVLAPPLSMEAMELQMQILQDKKEWEEKEAEKKKKRKHRISVSLLKM